MSIIDIINNCPYANRSFMEHDKDIGSVVCKLCCVPCLVAMYNGQCEEIRKEYTKGNKVTTNDESNS